MAQKKKTALVCEKGHTFHRGGTCRVCPICEKEKSGVPEFLAGLAAPARRALQNAGIVALEQLAQRSEADVLTLHGMGPGSLPRLRAALKAKGLQFRAR